jgi:hypothetical protein
MGGGVVDFFCDAARFDRLARRGTSHQLRTEGIMSSSLLRGLAIGLLAALAPACGVAPDQEPIEEAQSALCRNRPLQFNGSNWVAKGDPGAAVFHGRAYFAFARTDSKIQILEEQNLADSCTTNTLFAKTLTDTTNYGPTLMVFNDKLYLAYVGQNRNLYMKRSPDGRNWDEATVPLSGGGMWRFRPALNVWTDNVLRVYAAREFCITVGGCANYLYQFDITSPTVGGMTVAGPFATDEVTNDSPTTTTWKNDIYLSWAGTDSNKPIYIKHFNAITHWSVPSIVTGANGRPSLWPTSPDLLTILYRGNNATVYSVNSDNGGLFGASTPNNATTNASPAPFQPLGSSGIWTLYIGTNGGVYTFPMLP